MPLLYQLVQVLLNKKDFNLLTSFLGHLQNCQTLITLSIYKHNLLVYSYNLDILAKLIPFSEILWKHIHIFYIYTTHIRLRNWWRYHHHLNVSWNTTLQFYFFFCSENDAVKKIFLIIVYGRAFFHPYFCYRYKNLIYLVTLQLWYGYGYWLHILLLFSWILFFDTCPCLDCCLVLDLAFITSTLNIYLVFDIPGYIATVIRLRLLASHSFTVFLDTFLWHLSLPWLLFSVRFSFYNFYLEHNFDFFSGWSNFWYFVLLRFAFTTFFCNLSWLETFSPGFGISLVQLGS